MAYLLMYPSHLDRHVAHSRPSVSTCWVSSVTKLWVSSAWCFVPVVPLLGWESLIMVPHTLCLSFQSGWKWLMGKAQILFESFFFFFFLPFTPTNFLSWATRIHQRKTLQGKIANGLSLGNIDTEILDNTLGNWIQPKIILHDKVGLIQLNWEFTAADNCQGTALSQSRQDSARFNIPNLYSLW